jgi:hypothetical protein
MRPRKRHWRPGGFAMSIGKMLVVIGIMLTFARILLGYHCWFFAVEAFVRFAAAVVI